MRYGTEEEIIKLIDDCHSRAKEKLFASGLLEEEIRESIRDIAALSDLRASCGDQKKLSDLNTKILGLEHGVKQRRAKIKKLQKGATNLIEKRVVRLGKALAAFRTMPMDAVLGKDVAVVLT
jgi:hypothetical protein